jgi:hypothetical protein
MTRGLPMSAWLLLVALALGAVASAQAQTGQRLDATYSSGHVQVNAQWETPYRRGIRPTSMMIARIAPFELRLAIPNEYLSPPRAVRVYIVLPLTALNLAGPGSLELAWQTGGKFLAGRVAAGQRALLFQGVPDGPELRDQMRLTLRVDGVDVLDRLEIEPIYEIEAQ